MLLYRALEFCLNKLPYDEVTVDQQNFLMSYLAIAYFRIPEFRTKLLDCFRNDNQVEDWKETHFILLESDTTGFCMNLLFNWTEEFYDRIANVSSIYMT